jgi:hypothetical protein
VLHALQLEHPVISRNNKLRHFNTIKSGVTPEQELHNRRVHYLHSRTRTKFLSKTLYQVKRQNDPPLELHMEHCFVGRALST